MAKRRTRKQKERARHAFTISWKPSLEAENLPFEANVNRQFASGTNSAFLKGQRRKLSKNMGEIANLASVKKDLVKSLTLATLILASEIVLYLIWY